MNAAAVPDYSTERVNLAAAHRLCAREGMNEGTWNHMSLVLPGSSHALVTPDHTHWSRVTASALLVVGADGSVVEGSAPVNESTWIIHGPVHAARPDAQCIIHLHAPFSTALFCQEGKLFDTRLTQSAAMFHDDVAYFDTYDGALRHASEGARMAAALGSRAVLVLRNHGTLYVGRSVGEAFMRAYQFERACRFQMLAEQAGSALSHIPAEIVGDVKAVDSGLGLADAQFRGWIEVLAPPADVRT